MFGKISLSHAPSKISVMWIPSSGLTNFASMKTIKHYNLTRSQLPFTILNLNLFRGSLGCHHFGLEYLTMCCWGMKPTVVPKETCTAQLSPHQLCECGRASTASCGKFTYRLQWEWKDQVRIKILSDFLFLILNHLLDHIHPWERRRCPGTWSTEVSVHHRKLLILRGKIQEEAQDTAERKAMMKRSSSFSRFSFPEASCLWILYPRQYRHQGKVFPDLLLPEFKLPFSTAHQK